MKNSIENDFIYMINNCLMAEAQITKAIMEDDKEHKNILTLLSKLSENFNFVPNCVDNLEIYNKLNHQVNDIKILIDKEVKVEIEIAFLPYKSSMWDCMESVWQSAKEDQNCKCYVIPIPYFEINGNGADAEFCYEGDKFPKYVPITDYLEYNLEKHHPDVIYFHNPYDQYNCVTQVEKTYFSSNLKEYTDMLVYIPYFVEGSYSNINNAIQMCKTAGAMNSDITIVQSRKHKELFEKIGFESSKLVECGSPKFDATLNSCKNHPKLPEEWKEVFEGRKVFLWNISLENMINEKKWIEQIGNVVDIFYKNNKCALICRPHPLMDTAIQSMRPQYKNKYIDLKQKLYNMENAVIDMESDVYPAISISDALISDYSSIMFQYAITGKPILSVNHMSSLKNKYICIFDFFSNYFVNDGISIELFIDMVLRGEDPKKADRLIAMKNSTLNTDGSCGMKVHKCIMKKLLEGKR